MRRLAILGASGHGKVVADTAECCGWEYIDFFDDAWPTMTSNGPWAVVGTGADLVEQLPRYSAVVVAIGNNLIRQRKLAEFLAAGANLITLVHPGATISRHASIGKGSVVFAGVQVNACASIGTGAILNTGCSIDHDCALGNSVHISPGVRLAGGVHIGNFSWVGIGACVRQLIHIGDNVVVGAGAAVVNDIPDGLVVVGVPARPRD